MKRIHLPLLLLAITVLVFLMGGTKTYSSFTGTTALPCSVNIGAAIVSGTTNLVAAEFGDGYFHTTILSGPIFTGGSTTIGGTQNITRPIYTFPEGVIIVDAVIVDMVVSSASLTDKAVHGVGSAAGTTAGDLATTEQDMLLKLAMSSNISAPGTVSQKASVSVINGGLVGDGVCYFDGTSAAVVANFSIVDVGWSATANDLAVTATAIRISWRFIGDY